MLIKKERLPIWWKQFLYLFRFFFLHFWQSLGSLKYKHVQYNIQQTFLITVSNAGIVYLYFCIFHNYSNTDAEPRTNQLM